MKKTVIALVIAGTCGAIAYGWSLRSKAAKPSEEVATATVSRGSIRTVVASTGRVVPNLDVQIKCKASGEIIKLPFDVSDIVKKGDLLLQIDPIDEERMVKQSEAALASSTARLQTARTNLAVAKRDLETERMRAQANLISAEANARDAKAKAQRMKELLAKKLTSPEEAETADTTAAKLDVDFKLATIRLEELKTQGQVKVGQEATITADAFSGKDFEGKVIRIATQGVNLNNVVTFEVKIEVVGKNKSLLKPEMTANVAIITAQRDDVLLAPVEAVLRKAGQQFATVVNGEAKEERKVRTGLNDMTNLEIVEGLNEGDVVAVRKEEAGDSRFSGRRSSSMGSPFMPSMGRGRR